MDRDVENRTRREWLQQTASSSLAFATSSYDSIPSIEVDPTPVFPISPRLYMQFMEPLGVTDSSVEAAWDYSLDNWRPDFVETVRDLAPGAMRCGGNFSRYYKWREGVGPVNRRPWMRNYDWGGKETNRVGTHEFVTLCRQVGAEPFYCVNFEGDGIAQFRRTSEGDRTGDAREAADWVSYANDPDNRERRSNGFADAYNLKLWQIGNETSYVDGAFPPDEAIAQTITFARAMRERDRSIELIGWGDRDHRTGELWARELVRRAGEHLNLVAIHMMGQSPKRRDTVLVGQRYQADPERAWQELLELTNRVETRLLELEDVLDTERSPLGIAVTEGHLSLRPHNINPVLYEWLSAVYHARSLNIYQRHGARVKIATAADFNGTRWTVMALHTPVPRGRSFLLPVGTITQLFKRHNGTHGIRVTSAPSDLDIAASITEGRLYLHVLNTSFHNSVRTRFGVRGRTIAAGRLWQIAPENPRSAVSQDAPNVFAPREERLESERIECVFPRTSVSVVELNFR